MRSCGSCCDGPISVSARASTRTDLYAHEKWINTHERPHFRIKWRSTDSYLLHSLSLSLRWFIISFSSWRNITKLSRNGRRAGRDGGGGGRDLFTSILVFCPADCNRSTSEKVFAA